MTLRMRHEFQILVKLPTGGLVILSISPYNFIIDIKLLIYIYIYIYKQEISFNEQKLIYAGRQLSYQNYFQLMS